jgi:hypothetical protein
LGVAFTSIPSFEQQRTAIKELHKPFKTTPSPHFVNAI